MPKKTKILRHQRPKNPLVFLGALLALLFALFVWPTPYSKQPTVRGMKGTRENRFTGKQEICDYLDGKWKTDKDLRYNSLTSRWERLNKKTRTWD